MSVVSNILNKDLPLSVISQHPRLADRLSTRTPSLVPERVYKWAVGWIYEIGGIMRSRNFIASNAAYGLLGIGKMLVFGQQTPKRR